jgi:hypothetical protein
MAAARSLEAGSASPDGTALPLNISVHNFIVHTASSSHFLKEEADVSNRCT